MKKTLIGLAAFALTLLPATAFAQSQSSSDNSVKVENVQQKGERGSKDKKAKSDKKDRKGDKKGKKGDKKDRKDMSQNKQNRAECGKAKAECKAAKGDFKKGGKGMEARKGFGKKGMKAYNDSVNLASLNLNESQISRIKALNEARRVSANELREQARQARQSGDTAFVFDGSQIELVQSKYLKDLREVLTADQYVQFLENNYVKGGQKGMDKGAKMMRKGDRPMQRDGRMIKPMKANANTASVNR